MVKLWLKHGIEIKKIPKQMYKYLMKKVGSAVGEINIYNNILEIWEKIFTEEIKQDCLLPSFEKALS